MTPGADHPYEPTPWYAEGLRFACRACGCCCGGAPGYVWVDKEEVAAMASHLGMTARQFRRQYLRRLWRGLCLKEKSNYDCVLLDAAGRCVAYEVRPLQCRTWPFWPTNLVSRRAWDDAARRCPGMNSGPLYRLEQIDALRMEMDA